MHGYKGLSKSGSLQFYVFARSPLLGGSDISIFVVTLFETSHRLSNHSMVEGLVAFHAKSALPKDSAGGFAGLTAKLHFFYKNQ